MQLPIHLRNSLTITRLALVCAVSLATGLLLPVYSAASQTGTPTEERVTHEEERAAHQREREARERERAEARTAREQEREALRTKHEEERAARRDTHGSGHDESGSGSGSGSGGEAGADPSSDSTTGAANTDASAKALHGCRLGIKASSQRITAGETVTLSGALTCPTGTSTTDQTDPNGQTSAAAQTIAAGPAQTIAAGQRVALYARQLGGVQVQQNPTAAQTVSTAADGSYELTSPVLDNTSILQVRVGRHHARVVVKVAPVVTLTQSDGTFSGTVSPAVEGERVALQVSYPSTEEHWQTVAYGRVGADGGYSIAHAFHHPGEVNVRTVAHPHGPEVKGSSAPVAYEVPQPPAPTGPAGG